MLQSKAAVAASLAGAFVLGALAVAYSSAQQKPAPQPEDAMSHAPKQKVTTSFSELQEDEIGALVRDYLMENPQVIIEAVNKYSYEQRVAAITPADLKEAANKYLDMHNYVQIVLNPESQ